MSLISEILDHNRVFVERREYESLLTDRFPSKKLVILTCMDTRLVELLPQAMNLRNGEVKVIKNAGAMVSHPFGSVMRSILMAVYELDATEIAVVGHHDCGMTRLNCDQLLEKARQRGIGDDVVSTLSRAGIDLQHWLAGFDDVETSVKESVNAIVTHPLLPKNIPVHGLLIDPETGALDRVCDGYR